MNKSFSPSPWSYHPACQQFQIPLSDCLRQGKGRYSSAGQWPANSPIQVGPVSAPVGSLGCESHWDRFPYQICGACQASVWRKKGKPEIPLVGHRHCWESVSEVSELAPHMVPNQSVKSMCLSLLLTLLYNISLPPSSSVCPLKNRHQIAGEYLRMTYNCLVWIHPPRPCIVFSFISSSHSTLWGAVFINMNHEDLLRIWYFKHKRAFLWIHLLNHSPQINHKFYKLAHLGNYQIKPMRLRKKALESMTGLNSDSRVAEWGGLGDQGWQLLVTKREALGVAAEL